MAREKKLEAPVTLFAAIESEQHQALREIANEPLGNDVSAWRNWFSAHGTERTKQFRQEDKNQVLGNS